MSRSKLIKIDAENLKKEFRKRGLSLSEVCRTLGVSPNSYFWHVFNRGSISQSTAVVLETAYNIKLESYAAQDDPDPKEALEKDAVTEIIDYSKLYKCIYTATYHAMKKALTE